MKKSSSKDSMAGLSSNDFDEKAVDAVDFNQITKELEVEASETLINEAQRRRGEDWSILANQVVGAEHTE